MKRIPKKQLSYWIGKIGYDILDDIIAPACGISEILADLYLANVNDYAMDEKQVDEILQKIGEKYDIGDYPLLEGMPIACIALIILENGKY